MIEIKYILSESPRTISNSSSEREEYKIDISNMLVKYSNIERHELRKYAQATHLPIRPTYEEVTMDFFEFWIFLSGILRKPTIQFFFPPLPNFGNWWLPSISIWKGENNEQ